MGLELDLERDTLVGFKNGKKLGVICEMPSLGHTLRRVGFYWCVELGGVHDYTFNQVTIS